MMSLRAEKKDFPFIILILYIFTYMTIGKIEGGLKMGGQDNKIMVLILDGNSENVTHV